jgi:hypothetical protein
MTFTPKRFQSPPPPITAADVPVARLAADIRATVARQKFEQRMAPLADWIAHPETGPHTAAAKGEIAEMRHLLHDMDADSTEPPIPFPTAQEAS